MGARGELFLGDYESVISLTSDYTFTTSVGLFGQVVRPSVGLGLGRYKLQAFSLGFWGGGSAGFPPHTAFGIAPRVQLNIGPLILGLTYHYPFSNHGNFGDFVGNLGMELGGQRYYKERSSKKERVFKPFKVGMGYILGWGPKAGNSFLYIEPKYAITDHIGVGARGELFAGDYESVFSLTSDYTFTTKVVRPSVGLGLGLYTVYLSRWRGATHTAVGIAPRVQLNIGIIILGLTYHYPFSHHVNDHGNFGSFVGNLGVEVGGQRYHKERSSKKARVFEPFKVGAGLFSGVDPKAGLSFFYMEPKYAITDHIGVGARYEVFIGEIGEVYSLTSDYTFTTDVVRPSVGLGLGLYRQSFSIAPRIQLNIGPLIMGLTYHYIFRDDLYDSGFVGVNLGIEFGGRRYK